MCTPNCKNRTQDADGAEKTPRKRILIAIDNSMPSNWAVEYGGQLAKELSARVMLLHVVVPDTALVDSLHTQQVSDEAAQEESNVLLEDGRLSLLPRIEFERMQAEGVPADEIVAAAYRWEADLIVMGTRGRGRVAQFLLGSTAEAVIRRATCPVLTIGHDPVSRECDRAAKVYETV